jgi:mannosyltransferase
MPLQLTTSRNHNPYVSRRRLQRVEVAGRKITTYGIALLGIVLIGAFLRVYHLGTQSIWFDEAFSVWISSLTLPQMVQATAADVHPPLYYFLLHYWIIVFGTSESTVRLLSVLFGVLAIPMIYVVGRQLFNKETGLVGALILALSSFNIYYSQEARMYSLMVLLGLLSMYFFWRFLRQSNLVSSVGYVLSTTLLVYTHYYGWFVVIAQNIYVVTLLLLSKHREYRLRDWAVLQAIVVALFVPWMVVLIQLISHRIATGSNLAPPTLATISHTFIVYSGTALLVALFLGLSVLSLFTYQKVRGSMDWKAPLKALQSYAWKVRIANVEPVYFLAVWLFAINIIPFIISRFSAPIYSYSLERYAIAGAVALYLLVAKGINNINHRYTKVAVIGIIIVLSAANLQPYYTSITKPQAREATSFIDANLKSGDMVLVSPEWEHFTFDYYNNRTDIVVKPIHSWNVVDKPINSSATPSVNRPEDKIKEIQSDVSGHDRVWLLYAYAGEDKLAKNFTLSVLNESYTNTYKMSYYIYEVYLFEKRI